MAPTFPVAHPTWYDTIRDMFTATDIAHMSPQGLDLTSYEQVQASAGAIYGQVSTQLMPPGNPWTADMVQTFLNWMSDGYPKGTPAPAYPKTAAAVQAETVGRIRKDVNSLSDAERDKVKRAFEGMMAKDTSDTNSYFVQAGYRRRCTASTTCRRTIRGTAAEVAPVNKKFVGARLPAKMMGNPTISVHLPLQTE
jgi:tyrosinase